MRKTILLFLTMLIGYAAWADDPIEWRRYPSTVTFTDINNESVDLGAVLASGKFVLIEYTMTYNSVSWQRHQNGVLEALKNRFGDDLCVVWAAMNDEDYNYTRGLAGVGESTGTLGNWTLNSAGLPVNYYISNDRTCFEMAAFTDLSAFIYPQFFAPSGYCCQVLLSSNASDAELQVMRLMYNYPQEGDVPELDITGPARGMVGRSERYTARYNSQELITDIGWSAHPSEVELSCTDCGNPLVFFSPLADFGSSWGPSSAEITCVIKTSKYIVKKSVSVDMTSERNWEDTITYCVSGDEKAGSISAGHIIREYGIMVPAAKMRGRKSLVSVMQYITENGDYTLNVYQGGDTAPLDLKYTRTYEVDGGEGWYSFATDSLSLYSNDNMWITFTTSREVQTGAFMPYSGDSNGCWLISTGDWIPYRDRTWMIKAITSENAPTRIYFDISGPDRATVGETKHYTVVGGPEVTYSWSVDGLAPETVGGDNTGREIDIRWTEAGSHTLRCIAVGGSLVGLATLQVEVSDVETVDCDGVMPLPYVNAFDSENDLMCWTRRDNDGDGHGWDQATAFIAGAQSGVAHGGNNCLASASFYNGQDLTPDNWIISPTIHIPDGGATMEWWDQGRDANDFAEHYSVIVSADEQFDENSTTVFSATINAPRTWTRREVSLNDFAGQDVKIAFVHTDCTGQFLLLIDDLKITANAGGGPEGIGEASRIGVNIYPNPATNKVNIRADGIQRVELMDVRGRTLLSTNRPGIDLGGFPAGLYILRVTTADGTTVKRLTKE